MGRYWRTVARNAGEFRARCQQDEDTKRDLDELANMRGRGPTQKAERAVIKAAEAWELARTAMYASPLDETFNAFQDAENELSDRLVALAQAKGE